MTETAVKTYLSEIRHLLVCERRYKNELIADLKNDISEYAGDRDDVTKEELISVFGEPHTIASSITGETSGKNIRGFSVKKALITAIIAAFAVYVVFVIASFIDVHNEAHGYMETGILFAENLPGGADL